MTVRDRPKPKRPLRREFFPLAAVFGTFAVLAAIFPYGAVCYRPAGDAAQRGACTFVKPGEAEISAAMAAARAAFRTSNRGRFDDMRPDLSPDAIPESELGGVLASADRVGAPAPETLRFARPAYPPSVAAGRPEEIAKSAAEEDTAVFKREEMLKITE